MIFQVCSTISMASCGPVQVIHILLFENMSKSGVISFFLFDCQTHYVSWVELIECQPGYCLR